MPPIMNGAGYAPAHAFIFSAVWACSLFALVALSRAHRRNLLDVWLMVVMGVWICEVALAAVFNGGRFDLGFYAGRAYSLLGIGVVLILLLLQYASLSSQAATAAAALATQVER